uniref:Uncharacterized protein n=1 Tax=Kalanchoe fedtschenkoi TaxID=63787 RepID=A0A7N0TW82_KALFE
MATTKPAGISCFKVELKHKDTITAALPLQDHYLPLSNLDLLLPPIDVSTFFCFKPNDSKKPGADSDNNDGRLLLSSFGSKVAHLKTSLAQALVMYYPFAGEISQNSLGEPQLLCNNRGVDFYEMCAHVGLHDLDLHNPDESIEGKFVPAKKNGTLAIQVTELRCGSIIIGCTFDHRIADAYSMNMFLVSWAELAQSKPVSIKPNFKRSLLNPRRPINCTGHRAIDDLFVTISSLPPPPQTPPLTVAEHKICSRIYVIPAAQLHKLQVTASSESGMKCTRLVSFSSFLWQLVAKCDSKNGKDALTTRLGIVVNGRSRMVNVREDANRSRQMMESYFGNVLTIPYGEEKVGRLSRVGLGRAAQSVAHFLKAGTSKDHFLDLIDWVEVRRPEAALARVYCAGTGEESAVVVSCGRGFPAREVDFGWGRAWVGSYHFPWGGQAGYVMPMPSPAGNGDWVVYMHLRVEQLKVVEELAGDVFRPLTRDYLDSTV